MPSGWILEPYIDIFGVYINCLLILVIGIFIIKIYKDMKEYGMKEYDRKDVFRFFWRYFLERTRDTLKKGIGSKSKGEIDKLKAFCFYFFCVSTLNFIILSSVTIIYFLILTSIGLIISLVVPLNIIIFSILLIVVLYLNIKIKNYHSEEIVHYINYFKFMKLFGTVGAVVIIIFSVISFSYFEKINMSYKNSKDEGLDTNVIYVDGSYYKKANDLNIFPPDKTDNYTVYTKEDIIIVPKEYNKELYKEKPKEISSNSMDKRKEMPAIYTAFFQIRILAFIVMSFIIVVMVNLSNLTLNKST